MAGNVPLTLKARLATDGRNWACGNQAESSGRLRKGGTSKLIELTGRVRRSANTDLTS
jgi:hypothetical protein